MAPVGTQDVCVEPETQDELSWQQAVHMHKDSSQGGRLPTGSVWASHLHVQRKGTYLLLTQVSSLSCL